MTQKKSLQTCRSMSNKNKQIRLNRAYESISQYGSLKVQ